jgi:hypothetical protein
MKLTAAKIKEAEAWVEKHGLHPQPCGASVGDFCKAMGIGERTAYRWFKLAEMADALNAAREKFKARTVRDVENALVKAALGIDAEVTKEKAKAFDDVVREYDPVTGNLIRETKTKKLVTVEATRERRYFTPDIKAAQFVLTNLAPEVWKNRQEQTVRATDGSAVQITVGSAEVQDALGKVLAAGAAPRQPDKQDDTQDT